MRPQAPIQAQPDLRALREAIQGAEANTPSEPDNLPVGWDGADAATGGGLRRGAIHEWLSPAPDRARWLPPLGVLLHLAARALGEREGWAVWIGPRAWPYAPGAGERALPALLARSIFVAPRDRAEKVWASEQALRTPGVAVVIADGAGLGMGDSRKLQLAAGVGAGLGLIARPLAERREVSAAWTRWSASPAPSDTTDPRWTIELLRCKGVRPASEDARRWTVRRGHETGDVRVVPEVRGGRGAAQGASLALG